VMYPRFQERYGQTQTSESLRVFVELQLHVLADVLLAAIAVLLVALPPAITTFLPQYAETIAPLRVMLAATYFVALATPAGQFLLTIRKQTPALLVALPGPVLAVAAGYMGSPYGLVGVAAGITITCLAEFVAINAYALSHFSRPVPVAAQLAGICGTAAACLAAAVAITRFVPAGPPAIAVVGGWQLLAVAVVSLPLLARAARRIHALQGPDSVDKVPAGH